LPSGPSYRGRAATGRIRLGTGVLLLPYHHPVVGEISAFADRLGLR
jgi:alkanesulfonate monooxygenase SsuD/methylene tetrahydromethanopterin reductase-like flavin-dependent oxidoreductase (luciferase family)